MALLFAPLESIFTVVVPIRISQLLVLRVLFIVFPTIFILLCFFLLGLLFLLSFDESDSLNDEPEDYGSDSVSVGTCAFPFRFEESVVCVEDYDDRVGGVGYGVFVPTVIE